MGGSKINNSGSAHVDQSALQRNDEQMVSCNTGTKITPHKFIAMIEQID
jgi:hypothetical protein